MGGRRSILHVDLFSLPVFRRRSGDFDAEGQLRAKIAKDYNRDEGQRIVGKDQPGGEPVTAP
jgi:hypothetical protein